MTLPALTSERAATPPTSAGKELPAGDEKSPPALRLAENVVAGTGFEPVTSGAQLEVDSWTLRTCRHRFAPVVHATTHDVLAASFSGISR